MQTLGGALRVLASCRAINCKHETVTCCPVSGAKYRRNPLVLQVVQELSSNVVVIEKLENFQYKDKNGKDFGENVRHRAKQLAELIIDPDRIREERRKVRHGRITPCLLRCPVEGRRRSCREGSKACCI